MTRNSQPNPSSQMQKNFLRKYGTLRNFYWKRFTLIFKIVNGLASQPKLWPLILPSLKMALVRVPQKKFINTLHPFIQLIVNRNLSVFEAAARSHESGATLKSFWLQTLAAHIRIHDAIPWKNNQRDYSHLASVSVVWHGLENLDGLATQNKPVLFVTWHHSTWFERALIARHLPRVVTLGTQDISLGNWREIDGATPTGAAVFYRLLKEQHAGVFGIDGSVGRDRKIFANFWGVPCVLAPGYARIMKLLHPTTFTMISHIDEAGQVHVMIKPLKYDETLLLSQSDQSILQMAIDSLCEIFTKNKISQLNPYFLEPK